MGSKTITLLVESVGANLHDLGLGNVVLDIIPKAQAAEEKIGKLDHIKFNNFCAMIPLRK